MEKTQHLLNLLLLMHAKLEQNIVNRQLLKKL